MKCQADTIGEVAIENEIKQSNERTLNPETITVKGLPYTGNFKVCEK
jgi:hypothetical protein